MSQASVRRGAAVAWAWGKGTAEGHVTEVHTHDVSKTIKGKTIKRKASRDKPAAVVKTEQGALALKSASELKPR